MTSSAIRRMPFFRRNGSTERRAHNGFENECGSIIFFASVQMSLQVGGASEFALRKRFIERAVIAEARRDVAPIGDQRLVGRAARDISAHGHRAECAPVIALAARENAVTILLTGLDVVLANQFNRRLCRFGAAGSEADASALTKIRGCKHEEPRGKFFSLSRMKL